MSKVEVDITPSVSLSFDLSAFKPLSLKVMPVAIVLDDTCYLVCTHTRYARLAGACDL